MAQFHETIMGRRFFESQLPHLIKNLGRIADVMEAKQESKKADKISSEDKDNH